MSQRIAALIPAEYRKEILELNMIDRAIGNSGDATMTYLATIWQSYVETDFSPDCNLCYGRVLTNFKKLKPFLIQMEKDSNLLKQT
jgi:hypothetical protein